MTSTHYVREQPAETEAPAPPPEPVKKRAAVSRRGLLGAAGAGFAGLAAGAAGGFALGSEENTPAAQLAGTRTYPFYGERQAGILTPVQDRLHFAAFDVITDSREELVQLLKDWTAAAARMTQGLAAGELGPTSGPYAAPPDDTGEAMELPASGLTITFGFGPKQQRRRQNAAPRLRFRQASLRASMSVRRCSPRGAGRLRQVRIGRKFDPSPANLASKVRIGRKFEGARDLVGSDR